MLDPTAVWETVLAEIILGHLPQTGKGTSLNYPDKNFIVNKQQKPLSFPRVTARLMWRLRIIRVPPLLLHPSSSGTPSAKIPVLPLGLSLCSEAGLTKRGHLLSDGQPSLRRNATAGCFSWCPTISSFP